MPFRLAAALALMVLITAGLAGCVDSGDGGDGGNGTGPGPGGNGGGGGAAAAPGRIAGVVVDDRGVALAEVKVDLSRVFDSTTTGADGAFAFEGVAPGSYRLTFVKEFYRRHSEPVTLEDGGDLAVDVALEPVMLTEDVPAAHGKIVQYVATGDDVLLKSVGPPGLRSTVTNHTKEATFPGFWAVEPEEGYLIARLTVMTAWLSVPPVPPPLPPPPDAAAQELGVHYFRGESPSENELVENPGTLYSEPEAVAESEYFRLYQIENDDWLEWGGRTWQVGVYALNPNGLPLGAGILHGLQVQAVLVSQEYAEGL